MTLLLLLYLLPASVTAQKFVNSTMTNLPLDIKADQTLYVIIKAEPSVSIEKIQIVKDAVMSNHSFTKDGKKFYEGWQGALRASEHHTMFHMPVNLEIANSANNHVKVTITLTSSKSDLGYSGYTSFSEYHKMLENTHIVIYETDKLSDGDLAAIARHEFGHALGLGHSSSSSDLMYPNVDQRSAFISEYNVEALSTLYNGKILSQYFEEKTT